MPTPDRLIPVEEAQQRILAAMTVMPAELAAVSACAGRVLAADQQARLTQPWAAVSAMDGYAVRAADLEQPATLTLQGAVAAGGQFQGELRPGHCVRIFTGAPLPPGADTVVIQEDVTAAGDRITFGEPVRPGRHVRPGGLDFRAGDTALRAGRRLTPRDIGLAAAMNLPWLPVRRRPRVAILSTGSELVLPGEPIGPSQIISSNGLALTALVRAAGAEAIDLGIAPDRPEALAEAAQGAAGADLLVTIGGASVGDHDLVRAVLADRGLSLDFWSVAMRPGKPLMFGRSGPLRLLGLPGNPVSALVCGLVFLRPAIRAMLGLPTAVATATLPLGRDLPANDRRQDYLRSTVETAAGGQAAAHPFAVQDSSMISLLAGADCLVVRPPHAPAAKSGTPVPIVYFRDDDPQY